MTRLVCEALDRALLALDAARLAGLPAQTQAEDEITRARRLVERARRRLRAGADARHPPYDPPTTPAVRCPSCEGLYATARACGPTHAVVAMTLAAERLRAADRP